MADTDYVLGTHDEELERLGAQHAVWRPYVLEAWTRAGIGPASRVVDVGAGPGYAAADLTQLVGPSGRVHAVERSPRYVDALRQRAQGTSLTVQQADIMVEPIAADGCDAAWCRWVGCFVPQPATLVDRIAATLRPGGMFVSHEYVDYAAWRLLPSRPSFEAFVAEVMASWRAGGGEPDVARVLPSMLQARGFAIRSAKLLAFAVRPRDPMWTWPAGFVRTGARRLHDLGRVSAEWVQSVLSDFDAAERDEQTIMLTPTLLEIISERANVSTMGFRDDHGPRHTRTDS